MKKLLFGIAVSCFTTLNLSAQVGINTTNPQASLEIVASDANNPDNKDGLLVPRVANFPSTNPVSKGLLIYLNDTDNNNAEADGFYVWDGSGWMAVSREAEVSGSGTNGRLAFWNGSSSLSSNSNLVWDNNNNRLGIGRTPLVSLDVAGTVALNNNSLLIRDGSDLNHGLTFDSGQDGPRLFGFGGGLLSYDASGASAALKWESSGITFGNGSNSYKFPFVRGTNGQVLTTNGSGDLSWSTIASGGLTSLNGLTAGTQTFAT